MKIIRTGYIKPTVTYIGLRVGCPVCGTIVQLDETDDVTVIQTTKGLRVVTVQCPVCFQNNHESF